MKRVKHLKKHKTRLMDRANDRPARSRDAMDCIQDDFGGVDVQPTRRFVPTRRQLQCVVQVVTYKKSTDGFATSSTPIVTRFRSTIGASCLRERITLVHLKPNVNAQPAPSVLATGANPAPPSKHQYGRADSRAYGTNHRAECTTAKAPSAPPRGFW
ncbi:hypothetical protein LEN26_014780 [Aphanomyces euteiches]|nr:hypothetical protein LEN26_014780 [Aphanomyces euteiches]KAH9108310.1 hypothetical protein AeMF1_016507 [Aphanomyces euteiches]